MTIKSSPFFVCWLGSMGFKIKHTTKPRCKIQISRNIKRLSGFGGNERGNLLRYSIQKAGLSNVALFILDVKHANRIRIKRM